VTKVSCGVEFAKATAGRSVWRLKRSGKVWRKGTLPAGVKARKFKVPRVKQLPKGRYTFELAGRRTGIVVRVR
jgi:hypothetical protein